MDKINIQGFLKFIQRCKNELKKDKVMQEACNHFNFNINDLDLIPVKLDDISVSATTERGVVALNYKLFIKNNVFDILHYLQHEFIHYFSQSIYPTQSADDGKYLENEDEQLAFQYQVEFIDNNAGTAEANKYVSQVLDHHNIHGKERKEKKDILTEKIK